jgi:hypothetical protein
MPPYKLYGRNRKLPVFYRLSVPHRNYDQNRKGGKFSNIPRRQGDLLFFEREGRRSQGVSWAVCGSGAPPYEFLNLDGVFNSAGFGPVVPEKRLDLKSLKGQTKAEEVGDVSSSRFSRKTYMYAKWRNRGCTAGGRTLS